MKNDGWAEVAGVNCRIGSLESERPASYTVARVNCRIGSLEIDSQAVRRQT